MTVAFTDVGVWILCFVRIVAMVGFNPIFSRRNISTFLRMGFILVLTIVIAPTVKNTVGTIKMDLVFAGLLLFQIFVGYCLNFVFQIFYYMLFFVGDFLDVQFGMSMAKIFDPGSSVQMSLSGNFLNVLFLLYFILGDGHLTLLKIFSQSFQILPLSGGMPLELVADFMLNLFTAVFTLGIKLILPFAIVEFVVEISMGVLMRIIPQIHVFVINIQMKLLVGLILLLMLVGPMASFVDHYIILLFDNMQKVLIG